MSSSGFDELGGIALLVLLALIISVAMLLLNKLFPAERAPILPKPKPSEQIPDQGESDDALVPHVPPRS